MPRLVAWNLLRSGRATPLRRVEAAAAHAGLDDRDRALLRQLVATEVRRRGTLRAMVSALSPRKPSPEIATFLHLGLVQLFFLSKIPPYAAIAETSRASGRVLGQSKSRRVRELLKLASSAGREGHCGDARRDLVASPWHFESPLFRDPKTHPFLWAEDALSMPAGLVKRWAKRHGQTRAFALARRFLSEDEQCLRVVRGTREELLQRLEQDGISARPGAHERALRVPASAMRQVLDTAAFREGSLTVQGETAQRAAELLEARPGERLLDLCAAPGAKTMLLAGGGAQVLALDKSASRLRPLLDDLGRLAPEGKVVAAASDGVRALGPDTLFDGILIDAPCSNTGVLGRRPEARWRFGPSARKELVSLQTELLEQASGHVRAGGRLVWSTCSLRTRRKRPTGARILDRAPRLEAGGRAGGSARSDRASGRAAQRRGSRPAVPATEVTRLACDGRRVRFSS